MLVTRAAHQTAAFARALEQAGAVPVAAPLVAFGPPDDVQAAAYAAYHASQYAWIVFTSANAVDAFFDLLDARREDARFLAQAKIAAVGTATAAALRARNIYADLVPRTFVAEALADALIAAAKPGARLLLFRAQEGRDVLPDALRAAGFAVDVIAGYKTFGVHDPELAQKVAQCDILTFTSPSAVAAFCENLGGSIEAARGKTIACIGPMTAQAAREHGLAVGVVAAAFTADGLRDALRNAGM
ncbi:MAG: uroporphyrinogen-III synthase [Candidatus Baltobacteraceae bacterium]